jgi:hypothetical protein
MLTKTYSRRLKALHTFVDKLRIVVEVLDDTKISRQDYDDLVESFNKLKSYDLCKLYVYLILPVQMRAIQMIDADGNKLELSMERLIQQAHNVKADEKPLIRSAQLTALNKAVYDEIMNGALKAIKYYEEAAKLGFWQQPYAHALVTSDPS